jgi:hypothetical protein
MIIGAIVVLGASIGLSATARPLGSLPYRWGTLVGIWSVLVALFLFRLYMTSGRAEILAILALVYLAIGAGILLRSRVGVALLLVTQTLSLIAGLLVRNQDVTVRIGQGVVGLLLLGANLRYFGRRWTLMGRRPVPAPETQPESPAPIEEQEIS